METTKKFEITVNFWNYKNEEELNDLIKNMRNFIGGGQMGTGGSYKVVGIGEEIPGKECLGNYRHECAKNCECWFKCFLIAEIDFTEQKRGKKQQT